ncbi:MAG: hypothetical protein Q9209_006334 [Squamulea sp. 1 TL-2023]
MSIAGRFSRLVTSPIKYHIYLSRSHDVAVNLSIEHYLFQKSHPTSTILFLYVNRPCIVIGKGQNPWLEVNYPLVRRSTAPLQTSAHPEKGLSALEDRVQVIRRRSGGGTVFHDLGNVNFSVIFAQKEGGHVQYKHAEMVVQAIRKTNPRARVNKRHDIVLDPGPLLEKPDRPDNNDAYRTAFHFDEEALIPRKVSGSAGKISRGRALHHGTCLLASPNLSSISEYLRSPAEPFLKTKGVPSFRSPVDNIVSQATARPTTSTLQSHIIDAFVQMYNINISLPMEPNTVSQSSDHCAAATVDDTLLDIPDIRTGYDQLQTPEWLYEQTPQFTLSSHRCPEDDRVRPPLPGWFPSSARIHLRIKSGIIIANNITLSTDPNTAAAEQEQFSSVLNGSRIIKIDSFRELLGEKVYLPGQERDVRRVGAWLDMMLGKEVDFDIL